MRIGRGQWLSERETVILWQGGLVLVPCKIARTSFASYMSAQLLETTERKLAENSVEVTEEKIGETGVKDGPEEGGDGELD